MNPQIPQRRFYIGSAAIFWLLVALFTWGILFYQLRPEFKDDIRGAWFFASYFSAPAVFVALLAVVIRNMTRSAVPAWLITPPAFVLVGYLMLLWIGRFFIVGR